MAAHGGTEGVLDKERRRRKREPGRLKHSKHEEIRRFGMSNGLGLMKR
jgi:hypothetical protein